MEDNIIAFLVVHFKLVMTYDGSVTAITKYPNMPPVPMLNHDV